VVLANVVSSFVCFVDNDELLLNDFGELDFRSLLNFCQLGLLRSGDHKSIIIIVVVVILPF